MAAMANPIGSDRIAQNQPVAGSEPAAQTDERFRSQVYQPGEMQFATFNKLPDRGPIAAHVPTIAFLDSFSRESEMAAYPNGKDNPGLSHGDASAIPAQVRGYNVLRLEPTDKAESEFQALGMSVRVIDFGKLLTDVSHQIDNGTLPLGHGDALNISMNNKLMPADFVGASRVLGMDITPENLQSKVKDIMDKMEQMADSGPQAYRSMFKELVASNKAIIDIQNHGIEVVNSAGNFGKNIFDLGFITAQTHLTGVDESGRYYVTSSQNSMSAPSLSNYSLFYEPPAADGHTGPAGRYKLGNLPVYLDANQFGGVNTVDSYYKRTAAGFSKFTSNHDHVVSGEFSPLVEQVDLGPPINYQENPVAVIVGSSYGDIARFWDTFDQRKLAKQ